MEDKQQVTYYDYKDEQKVTLFAKKRIEPGLDGRSKEFQCARQENGQWVSNLEGCRKILYHLPELLYGISKEQTIFLVEGEKDADNLLKQGIFASTALVTSVWHEEYTLVLKDADVVILYDNDKAGLKRRDLISNSLYGKVKRLRVVDLPGIEYSESHGKDISDWLEMGNTVEQLRELVNKASEYVPTPKVESKQEKGVLRAVSISELFSLKIPPQEMLLAPFLPSQGLVMIFAKRGVGKTHIALGIAYAVATGGTFLRWNAPVPKRVLYIDGEMPASLMQERLQRIVAMFDGRHEEGFFKLLTPDLQDHIMPDLSHKQGRDAIEPLVQDSDLVVIDNLSCLFRSGNENEADSWQEAQEWALDLRRRGKSVLFVHHAGKSGNQRGTSKKEDALDAVILLKQPDDYQPEQGARFEVHFEKTRHFAGDQAITFQAQLTEQEDGSWKWVMSNIDHDPVTSEVANLREDGDTIIEIMNKLGLSKSQVETRLKKAKQLGLLS